MVNPIGYVCEKCGCWIPRLDTADSWCNHDRVSLPENLTAPAVNGSRALSLVMALGERRALDVVPLSSAEWGKIHRLVSRVRYRRGPTVPDHEGYEE